MEILFSFDGGEKNRGAGEIVPRKRSNNRDRESLPLSLPTPAPVYSTFSARDAFHILSFSFFFLRARSDMTWKSARRFHVRDQNFLSPVERRAFHEAMGNDGGGKSGSSQWKRDLSVIDYRPTFFFFFSYDFSQLIYRTLSLSFFPYRRISIELGWKLYDLIVSIPNDAETIFGSFCFPGSFRRDGARGQCLRATVSRTVSYLRKSSLRSRRTHARKERKKRGGRKKEGLVQFKTCISIAVPFSFSLASTIGRRFSHIVRSHVRVWKGT